jgi:L-amino acid N-acyltransferase YncA
VEVVTCRKATLADIPAIAKIHVEAWNKTYIDLMPESYLRSITVEQRELLWHRIITQNRSSLFVATLATKVAGFVCFGPNRDNPEQTTVAEIYAIYVEPTHWRHGVGKMLLQECLACLRTTSYRSVMLWVLKGNSIGTNFYIKNNFAHTGIEKIDPISDTVILTEQQYIHNLFLPL